MLDVNELEKGLVDYRKSLLCEEAAEAALLSDLVESMGSDVKALSDFAALMSSIDEGE